MELTLAWMVSVTIVHCSLLKLNMWSAWYLRLNGIITDCTSFCVIDFSVSDAWATLIPHCLLKSHGVVFECCSSDNKSHGCLMPFGFFGGSGTVSMCMSFTSCSITILNTYRCCSLVAICIAIVCFPDIRTLATSFWLKRCVFNVISSLSSIWSSSSSIEWWYLIPILDTFHASISSFT